jgi:hypothetical protein
MLGMATATLLLAGALGAQPAAIDNAPAVRPPLVSVRQVLTMQALAGETVTVEGRCLGKNSPAKAPGSRPFSGEVWQIEDNGIAAWVIGPMPASCAGGSATITARVVQDQIPLFSPPRAVRQYLVVEGK